MLLLVLPAAVHSVHVSTSWWSDIGDVGRHLHGRESYARSMLRRVCPLDPSSTPLRYTEAACSGPDAVDVSTSRLLLEEASYRNKESYQHLLPIGCEKRPSGRCHDGLPSYAELSLVPPNEITKVTTSSTL